MIDIAVYLIFFVCLFTSHFLAINTPVLVISALRLLLILLILFSLSKNGGLRLSKIQKANPFIAYIFVFIIASCIQLFWVKDINEWFRYFVVLIEASLLFVFIPNAVDSTEKFLKCAKFFHFGVLIQMLIGFFEVFTGKYYFLTEESYAVSYSSNYSVKGFYTPVAMNYNTNNFATEVLIGCCFALILMMCSKTIRTKVFYGASIVLGSILIFLTGSRANMIALLLALAIFVIFFLKNKMLKGFLVILGIFATLLVVPLFKGFFESAGSNETRLQLYMDGFVFMEKSYFMGIGVGQEEWWFLNERVYSYGGVRIMHNYFLELLVCFGLIPFMFFIVSYFKTLQLSYVTYKHGNSIEANISSGIFIFFIAFVISSLSSSSLIRMEYIWLVFSLVFAFSNMCIRKRKKEFCNMPLLQSHRLAML